MKITINELRHDTCYFFYKQIRTIFFISIFIAFINLIIDVFVKPNIHIISIIENNNFINAHSLLELINSMSLEEKHELLKYSIFKIIESLMSKTVLLGSIIILISSVSNSEKKTIITSICSLFSFLPNLFILNFLSTIIIQIGFMLFIIPGVLLSITLSLSPIIFSFKKHGLIDSIRLSISISWRYIKIISPCILTWMFSKFILTVFLDHIHFLNKNILDLISNISMNILFSILIIYLFRFYMIFLRS
ncbi:envelope biogenesis factor ElyC [Buchnera aphidicola (Sitobion miscanthi)]|uniref:YciC family protein n=1 Tax=Buchnera aphidicola TaxID=9 RepID=UPI0020B6A27F|nr:YciC family protein [Buchnera aphidicola]MCU4136953.1 envelope biogenesis factor ElyC [Buchnera aphidicola (Sitobion miscanthi)]